MSTAKEYSELELVQHLAKSNDFVEKRQDKRTFHFQGDK